jgi:hypothetical protein
MEHLLGDWGKNGSLASVVIDRIGELDMASLDPLSRIVMLARPSFIE